MSGPSTSTDYPLLSRRSFLKQSLLGAGTLCLAGGLSFQLLERGRRRIPGELLGPSATAGHLLRDPAVLAFKGGFSEELEIDTVIIGGGVAGLSAAWWLRRNGHSDFKLLELEPEVGGNSASGRNGISAYPWGAHYLPLPGPDATLVRTLLEELQVIRGYSHEGHPVYDEFHLRADPGERLFLQGSWQPGLEPETGLPDSERADFAGFFGLLKQLKSARGRDGRRAFTIPMEMSSQDPQYLSLDRTSMAEFMRSRGWTSRHLHWYVDYCCRDDYGTGHEKVSAWAGLHYFASRVGKGANADSEDVLTWPEGNGWLVGRLKEKVSGQIRPNSLVYSVRDRNGDSSGAQVDVLDTVTRSRLRIHARQVICATPRFVAARFIESLRQDPRAAAPELTHSPWLVANVTVDSRPSGRGAPLAWDNVSFYSRSLGYIVANHQDLSLQPGAAVLTYYLPLDDEDASNARKKAASSSHEDWTRMVVADLEKMHPGISRTITRVDAWVWGHGMVSPGIGYLWGDERRRMLHSRGRIHFAHSDMSGISIFEEAQYRGVEAAKRVLASSKWAGART